MKERLGGDGHGLYRLLLLPWLHDARVTMTIDEHIALANASTMNVTIRMRHFQPIPYVLGRLHLRKVTLLGTAQLQQATDCLLRPLLSEVFVVSKFAYRWCLSYGCEYE